MKIYKYNEIDSTNSEALRILRQNNRETEDFAVCAEYQTCGRGQTGNKWIAQAGKNITMSVAVRYTDFAAVKQFKISQAVAVAVVKYLEKKGIANVNIKWPNDIYVGMKKICGILLETSIYGRNIKHAIAGIGLNINQTVFSDNLPNPISMKIITGEDYILQTEIEILAQETLSAMKNVDSDNLVAEQYLQLLLGKNAPLLYAYNDEIKSFITIGTDDIGRIIVKDTNDNKIKKYNFKEIELLIPQPKTATGNE